MRRRVPLAALADTYCKTATKILVEFAEQGLVGLGRINISKRSNVGRLSVGRSPRDQMPLAHALTKRFTARISRRDDICIRTQAAFV